MKPNSSSEKAVTEAKVLVVDDELHIRSALVRALNLVGYDAEEAVSGNEALALLKQTSYDLMVLDMLMPDIQGVVVMQQAHLLQPELLIVILTGHATLESAIAAIKSDATDYLLKPVSIHEIIDAITRALQKRAAHLQKERLASALELLQWGTPPASVAAMNGRLLVGPLKLDRSNHLVTVENGLERTVELSKGEAAVLASLMAHPGQTLSCQQLVQAAWGYRVDKRDAESVIRPYIFRLRHKLESDPKKPVLITTVRGQGYLFSPLTPPG